MDVHFGRLEEKHLVGKAIVDDGSCLVQERRQQTQQQKQKQISTKLMGRGHYEFFMMIRSRLCHSNF